jgi:putative hydrolase of the HAD superfamily
VPRAYEGLLIDVGGVLTTDIFPSFDAYCVREGLEGVSFRQLYFSRPEVQELLHRLEVGELHHAEAQGPLAQLLGLPEDRAEGLFPGLYADVRFIPEMTRAVEALRRGGVRTGVLSNSWWFPMYDQPFFARAFDVTLISGQIGFRKPEPQMFERGVEELGIPADRIVFVDDFEENLPPAEALGMKAVLHSPDDPQRTLGELERLFDVRLIER